MKTIHLEFSNLPELEAAKFASQLPRICRLRRPGQDFNIKIENIFNPQLSFFEIDCMVEFATNIEIFNMQIPIRIEKFLKILKVDNFTMVKTNTYYDITNVFLSANLNTFTWEATKFFPQFYQPSNTSQFSTKVNITGNKIANYLHKEVFFYCRSINLIHLSNNIERIEYGTFALPGRFKQFFCDRSTNDSECTRIESLFLEGKCHFFEQTLCEICYMHQYGFHKTLDNVKHKCSRKEPTQYTMLKCFWRDIQPIPESMQNLEIDAWWNITQTKPCETFPFDVVLFIQAINSADQNQERIPEQSEVTTARMLPVVS